MLVILIGMMGSGKTAVGKIAAKSLHWEFYDSDQLIELQEEETVADIFKNKGEKYFRRLENRVIRQLTKRNNCIIATGGGAPCFRKNWDCLKQGFTVWLKASPQTLLKRVKDQPVETRPLLKEKKDLLKNIAALSRQREKYYKKARRTIVTDRLTSRQTAGAIVKMVRGMGSRFTSTPPCLPFRHTSLSDTVQRGGNLNKK